MNLPVRPGWGTRSIMLAERNEDGLFGDAMKTCVAAGTGFSSTQDFRDDGGGGVQSPSYGFIYQGLKNCVISNNVLHEGALRQLMLDLGDHGDGVVVKDNPGELSSGKS